ncbi:MAG: molybdopterin cofactor-binding domain-containing protein [Anaerolineales bacterium]|nr:molybdopterin cofactor-binding domain-containing protein [Anaerolineales bacterium]
MMDLELLINDEKYQVRAAPGESLFQALRKLGFWGVKFGDEHGLTGSDTVLLDGKPVNSILLLAAQAEGRRIETIEQMGEHPQQGWKESPGLHILQQEFVKTGAIQCGYCTPAMVLAARELIEREPDPSEEQVRDALSGVLCRCTGYKKPVEAVLRAAARLRGEDVQPIEDPIKAPVEWTEGPPAEPSAPWQFKDAEGNTLTAEKVVSKLKVTTEPEAWQQVGKPKEKVDAVKLVQGKPAFAADIDKRDMLYAKVLHSPHAHARITRIDAEKARAMPGVAAVLTYQDVPRVPYSTAGQSDPIPGPLDCYSLDDKVRFVGDRVAFVAAETEEIAEQAVRAIEVEYDVLEPVLDLRGAMKPGAPVIHDQEDYVNFDESDPSRNLAAEIRIDIGDPEQGFAEADEIIEAEYVVPKVQQAHIEPHVVVTYWDEDDRLVIRTSTQVPFHVRRMIAPVLDLPLKRIRVIKPRIGGGFGGKQEMLIDDVAAHLTLATGRPVQYVFTREEEFYASRSRHPMRIRLKTGVKRDGTITANEMYALSDTGANGAHALTVTGNTGHKSMALYVGDGPYRESPNIRFYADIVYTNTPPSGAYRGYGVPQGYWPVERHMEKIAHQLGLDPLEFRLKNALRAGELHPFSMAWSEGREPSPEIIQTNGLVECVRQGKEAVSWDQKYGNPDWQVVPDKPHLRRGIGVALVMQGTAIPYLDMGGASLKLNDDGSFNLLVGATDLGTGSDTVLGQMAAEILGVPLEDIIVYSSDTDFTPFDKGAYASSTTYISGAAVVDAATKVADRLRERAQMIFNENEEYDPVQALDIELSNRCALAPDGRDVSIEQIALHSLHHADQEQIMAVGSFMSPVSPPPFGAQFAEVTVDVETGQVVVDRLVMAVDGGVIVNPVTASGQIEGGMTQALGYAVSEEMVYDQRGWAREVDFRDYHIFRSDEMPELETIFIETFRTLASLRGKSGGRNTHGRCRSCGGKRCFPRQRC